MANHITPRIAKSHNGNENNRQNVTPTNPSPDRPAAELTANQYRTANGQGRCTDLLLSSEIW